MDAETQRRKRRQHLLLDLPDPRPGCVWVHACSVGEVGSVAPLIRRILARGLPVHLSVVTATGHAHAARLLGEHIEAERLGLGWLPWDLPGAFARFIRRLQPGLLLLAETEFWPGMLRQCGHAGVPIVGVNTRISDRSFPRYRATRFFWRRALRPVERFLCQSGTDAKRLAAIGVPMMRIETVGNLKYAVSPPDVDAAALRARLDASGRRPVLLVASTHAGEEAALLAHLERWRALRADLLVVVVPRHPERFDAVFDLLRERGLRPARWSEGAAPPEADAVLVDAMGVLAGLYALADIAFIGGSLTDIGGHNPLEAAICGRGVVTGPHVQNFRDIMREMRKAGGAVIAQDAADAAGVIERWLARPDELRALHAAAAAFMRDRAGVLERTLAALEPWLGRLRPPEATTCDA
ncbi:MAG: 3-deoxy-D-manno-octulosonic acid transferase [Mariprofundaceae bacterium]